MISITPPRTMLLLLSLLFSEILLATNYYVNDGATANDAFTIMIGATYNGGTITGLTTADPVGTIQDIIDNYVLGPGDTIFIDAGTYIESLNLSSADAGNSTAPLVIMGLDSALTNILSPGPSQHGIYFLDGADYTTVKNIHFNSNGQSVNNIRIINSQGITIESCSFLMDVAASNVLVLPINSSSACNCDDITIRGSSFLNSGNTSVISVTSGTVAINNTDLDQLTINTSTAVAVEVLGNVDSLKLRNSTIDAVGYGIYFLELGGVWIPEHGEVYNNTMTIGEKSGASQGWCVKLRGEDNPATPAGQCVGFKIHDNFMELTTFNTNRVCIWLRNTGNLGDTIFIYNNVMIGGWAGIIFNQSNFQTYIYNNVISGSTFNLRIVTIILDNTDILFNSFYTSAGNNLSRPVGSPVLPNWNMKNNIFQNDGLGFSLDFSSFGAQPTSMDYNLFHNPGGGGVAQVAGATYFTLALMQAASHTVDGTDNANSIAGDPQYSAVPNNLIIPSSSPAVGAAIPIAGIGADLLGVTRPGTPTIGAYEPMDVPVANFATSDTVICLGQCIDFTNLSTFASTSVWTFSGATTSSSTAQNPTNICYDTLGTYPVKLVVSNLIGSDTLIKVAYITVVNKPTANLGSDTAFCLGNSIILDAQNAGATYNWHDGSSNQTFLADTSGMYSVTITDTNGCTASDTLSVTIVNPIPATISPLGATGFCQGDSVGLQASAGVTFLWLANGLGTGDTNQTIQADSGANYQVVVTDTAGCVDTSLSVVVFVNSLPVANINLPSGNRFCLGDSITLQSDTANSYQWLESGVPTGASGLMNFVNVAGNYQVIATSDSGCIDTSSMAIVILDSLPIIDTGLMSVLDASACGINSGAIAGLTILSGVSPMTFSWEDSTMTVVGNQLNLSNLASGIYQLEVIDSLGCRSNLSVAIGNLPALGLNITIQNSSCFGFADGSATAAVNGGLVPYTYAWSSGGTAAADSGLSAATYGLVVTDSNGCTVSDTNIVITEPSLFTVSITGDTAICVGDSTLLEVPTGLSYTWSTGATSNSISVTPLVTTSYAVTVSNGNCNATATHTVSVAPLPTLLITGQDILCFSETTTLNAAGGTSYLWSTNDTGATLITTPLAGTFISVTSSNTCGSVTDSIWIEVLSLPLISAGVDTTIIAGANHQLQGSGGPSYLWSPDFGLSCTVCANPVASPEFTTTYVLTVVDGNGCSSSDSVQITVDETKSFFIPNIFSPNGDGNNDVLQVSGRGIERYEIRIYSRWGELVFSANDLTQSWDGRFRGEQMDPAGFVYMVDIQFAGESEMQRFSGELMLVR